MFFFRIVTASIPCTPATYSAVIRRFDSRSHRPLPPVVVLAFLSAACGKAHRETGDEMLARAEMRDAWLATAVPFAVALLLLLSLIIIRRRRKPDTTLPGLFRPYRAEDIPRWWRERIAAFNDYRTRWRERAAAAAIERDRAIESVRTIEVARAAEVEQARLAQLAAEQARLPPVGATVVAADATAPVFPMNWGVALCAALSIAVLLATGMWGVVHDVLRETPDPADPFKAFAAHLFVLVAAVSGFRMTANLVAVLAALGWGFLCGVLVLLSLGTFAIADLMLLLQIALLVFAIVDVVRQKNREWHYPSIRRMLSGPVLGAVIALGMAAAFRRQEASYQHSVAEAAAQRARDSAAAAAEHVRELASPAWKSTAALYQLYRLTDCIDVYHRSGPKGKHQPFPRSFVELVRWARDQQRGYAFNCYPLLRDADTTHVPALLDPHHIVRYQPPPRLSDTTHARDYVLELEAIWTAKDEPVEDDAPAVENFLLDATGKVHAASGRRRATMFDPLVPVCRLPDHDLRICWIDSEYP
jgi:hypothetical protein